MTIFFQQIVGDNEDDAYKRKHVFVSFARTHTHTQRAGSKSAHFSQILDQMTMQLLQVNIRALVVGLSVQTLTLLKACC